MRHTKVDIPVKFRQYIERRTKIWYDRMGLWEWHIETVFYPEEPSDETAASIKINHVYLWGALAIYSPILDYWKQKKYDSIDEAIVHELCHLLTEPLYRIALDGVTNSSVKYLEEARERQTQRIAQVVMQRFGNE